MEKKKLEEIGYKVTETKSSLTITHKGYDVVYWKKKKWFSGKTVQDGRGIDNLIAQLVGEDESEKHVDFYHNNPESYNHLIGIFQKHTQIKLEDSMKDRIKSEMKARFNISLARK